MEKTEKTKEARTPKSPSPKRSLFLFAEAGGMTISTDNADEVMLEIAHNYNKLERGYFIFLVSDSKNKVLESVCLDRARTKITEKGFEDVVDMALTLLEKKKGTLKFIATHPNGLPQHAEEITYEHMKLTSHLNYLLTLNNEIEVESYIIANGKVIDYTEIYFRYFAMMDKISSSNEVNNNRIEQILPLAFSGLIGLAAGAFVSSVLNFALSAIVALIVAWYVYKTFKKTYDQPINHIKDFYDRKKSHFMLGKYHYDALEHVMKENPNLIKYKGSK